MVLWTINSKEYEVSYKEGMKKVRKSGFYSMKAVEHYVSENALNIYEVKEVK